MQPPGGRCSWHHCPKCSTCPPCPFLSLRKSPDACLNRIRVVLNSAEQNLEVVPVSASVKTKLGRSGL